MSVRAPKRRRAGLWLAGVWTVVLMTGTGCSLDGLLKNDELPPDVTDPALTRTPEGALAVYRGALVLFEQNFGSKSSALGGIGLATALGSADASFIRVTGILSDELQGLVGTDLEDVRELPEGHDGGRSSNIHGLLNAIRAQAGQAINLLAAYVPEQPALQGKMYILQGYAEVFLAELFCSGIPLSTLDYAGDYTYKPGSTTGEVFTHASTLFDTALGLVADSADLVELARLGKGRALLALGEHAAAAAAVAAVPDAYTYLVRLTKNFAIGSSITDGGWFASVADREGFNGLDYRSSGDPRTRATLLGTFGIPVYRPDKYAADGSTPLVLASGLEARLIEAEAQLQANPEDGLWLATLNALRTDGAETRPTEDPNDDPAATYTYWRPGSGGVDSLAPLADPGVSLTGQDADTARVNLLFRERAFWLFLTGHRQGDMRRLIRQYGRRQQDVYPVGPYHTGLLPYGADVTVPIPQRERILNPKFTGCASRDA